LFATKSRLITKGGIWCTCQFRNRARRV